MGRSSTPLSSHAAQTRSAKGLSGSYRAEYVERGVTGKSAYRLFFADGRVTGNGWDADGDFQVLFVLNLVLVLLVLLGIGSRAGPSSFLPYSLFPCPFSHTFPSFSPLMMVCKAILKYLANKLCFLHLCTVSP